MKTKEGFTRFEHVPIGTRFVSVFTPEIVRLYQKVSLSTALPLDPQTLEFTGTKVGFTKAVEVLPLA